MKVKMMLEDAAMKPAVDQLELIDDLQRLGISYHFEDEIAKILTNIYEQNHVKNTITNYVDETKESDLYSTALEFRLLRQQGFSIPQEVFDCFKDKKDEFSSSLEKDIKGLLALYEASYLLTEGENTLESAREFSTEHLERNSITTSNDDENPMSLFVREVLEMPLHWRIQRAKARWFMEDAYEKRKGKNSALLLELAKLDFNIVQATHQEELKQVSRWWKRTCLAEKLPFARDRLVENYFWTIGGAFEPKYGYSRIMATKVNAFITVIDDMYDVYGTLEELKLFTHVIQRWDIEGMDQLPEYMQICFLALNNFINEMAYDVFKEQGVDIIPYLRKSWIDLCTTYLQEAKWYSEGYTPRLEEYIDNGWISISAPAILSHAYFLLTNPIEKEAVESLYEYHDIVRWSAMVLRLANDLGTSPHELKRGDVPKSIQCYMNERRTSEVEATEHVRYLIYETWKKMNKEQIGNCCQFPDIFIRSAVDLGRMAQYMYQHGDGHGIQNPLIKQRILSLLFEPVY
uniref:Putative limonene-myrcene synthase n=1 Tax=Scoparia dulcis TaxID=107240 RepID=A0A1W7HBY2_SCODU